MKTPENNQKNHRPLSDLEHIIGYAFHDNGLLEYALTHCSLTRDRKATYERMEFLGDAVVSLTVAEYLYHSEKDYTEGEMTEIKSRVVSRKSLMYAGRRLQLSDFLRVENGLSNSRSVSGSLTSDAYEAVVGAVFLDSDFDTAKKLVLKTIDKELSEAEEETNLAGYKSTLQERVQSDGCAEPEYKIQRVTGPPHDRRFEAVVVAYGEVQGTGWGRTKKQAEKMAARKALSILFPEEYGQCDEPEPTEKKEFSEEPVD